MGNSWGTSTSMSRRKRLSERKVEVPSLSNARVWLSAGVNLFEFCYTAGLQKSKMSCRQGDYILYGGPKYLGVLVGTCFMSSFWQLEFLRRFVSCSKNLSNLLPSIINFTRPRALPGLCAHMDSFVNKVRHLCPGFHLVR